MESIKHRNKAVGRKQVLAALSADNVQKVFAAEDADPGFNDDISRICAERGIEIEYIKTRKELGRACGVDVKTAVAALLKNG